MDESGSSIGAEPEAPNGDRIPARSRTKDPSANEAGRHIATVFVALSVALLVRALLVETYYVPSESMLPTLLIGDHMLVNKFAYGARLPLTDLTFPPAREPERGDVVTFVLGRQPTGEICPVDRCPDYPREGFVKRIIGVPGDELEIRGDLILLNGLPLRQQPADDVVVNDAGDELAAVLEFLDDGSHTVLDHPHHRGMDQVRITVPEGRYFLLGDNRDDSNDSRGWGTVARRDIIGPVSRLYWSWNNRGSWWDMLNPGTWWRLLTTETRWHRIGLQVK